MGSLCSNEKNSVMEGQVNAASQSHPRSKSIKAQTEQSGHLFTSRTMIEAQDAVIARRSALHAPPIVLDDATSKLGVFSSADDYMVQRQELNRRQRALAFDHPCTAKASRKESRADAVLQRLKRQDRETVYDTAEPRVGYQGQKHKRFPGDHFLSNVDLIERTEVFRMARRMPKGAHLHIHFNSCLPPDVLLGVAKGMDRMFITSDLPLTPEKDFLNFHLCELQFSLLPPEKECPGNLFSSSYESRQTMPFRQFLQEFPAHYQRASVDEYLRQKLLFAPDEAYNGLQTAAGTWEKFNGRTRMMKGLFNYESAYRAYTRRCLEDFVNDNIQYAEIRPNFMKTNQLRTDDAASEIDNRGIMRIIIEEYGRFQADTKGYFGGLKIIYCTPRSFKNELVEYALEECLEFKKEWPQWIAGFDLVGEEAAGKPLKAFIPELLRFRQRCNDEGLDIPFLFHCGETLDSGSDTDGNLLDALMLGARRIGHGFALARHPYVMEHMKARGVCLELCPISNEVLGLTPRVGGHAMYNLLANNVHCTVSSDNGTFFQSTLSHDFYQVMVGREDMNLHGWRQLVEWSLEHACMSDGERRGVQKKWEELWEDFLDWVIATYEYPDP